MAGSPYKAALVIAAMTLPVSAGADSIPVRMEIPLFCQAVVMEAQEPSGSGLRRLGILREACNNGSGYVLAVQHAPGIEGASVILEGDGGLQRIPLSTSGYTILETSERPRRRSRNISIEMTNPEAEVPWISLSATAS